MATMIYFYVLIMSLISCFLGYLNGQELLRVNFYSLTCPKAEEIVKSVVKEAVLVDNNMAAKLLRLHFHDCFVEGCDGSILIEGKKAEKHAFGHQGLGGFDVIERAKSQLERVCPGVVSCADIVAMAARDSVSMSNGPSYQVLTGRRDGRISDVSLADDMPDVGNSVDQLKALFLQKGLSEKDLVVLSAAHTIGTTACFFMTDRLYKFSASAASDPSINPQFLSELKSKCPENGDVNVRLPLDHGSPSTFDNNILSNIRNGFATLQSDAKLYEDEETRRVVDSYFGFLSPIFGPFFESDFANSMIKMGSIGVKTGSQGEIRRVCRAFN